MVAAAGLGVWFSRPALPGTVWAAALLCALVPDVDVVAFALGIPYEHMFGHRGITHSLTFAALLAALLVGSGLVGGTPGRARLWLLLFLATMSHGMLDALTSGGRGVAFFAPFDETRYFFPFRPIRVSPIGVTWLFSRRGAVVLATELIWVWLPTAAFVAGVLAWRRARP